MGSLVYLFNASPEAETMYDWGLKFIYLVQKLKSPVMTAIMEGISFLGHPAFYLLLVAYMYWCVDSQRGFKLGTAIIFSGALNTAIKETLQVSRPYQRDPGVFIVEESGYSTPSGHSQGAATFYPLLGKLFWILPLLIGFSRIYLGVHYPTDVALGLILGYTTSVLVMFFWEKFALQIKNFPRSIKILLAALVPFVLNFFSHGETQLTGLLFGFLLGKIFSETKNFDASSGTKTNKILRFVVGILLTVFIFAVFFLISHFGAKLFPLLEQYNNLIYFVFFGFVGFAEVFIIPRIFIILKLATEKH